MHAERGRLVPVQCVPSSDHTTAPVHSLIIRRRCQLSTTKRLYSDSIALITVIIICIICLNVIAIVIIAMLAGRERILSQDSCVKKFLCSHLFGLLELLSALFPDVYDVLAPLVV